MRNFSVATTSWRERRRTSGSAPASPRAAPSHHRDAGHGEELVLRGRITSRVRDSAPRRKLTRNAASEVSRAPLRDARRRRSFTTRKRMSEAKAATTTGHPVSRDTSTERPATSATSGCVRAPRGRIRPRSRGERTARARSRSAGRPRWRGRAKRRVRKAQILSGLEPTSFHAPGLRGPARLRCVAADRLQRPGLAGSSALSQPIAVPLRRRINGC